MPPLILSSMIGDAQALNLSEFKVDPRVYVRHRYLDWSSALTELMDFAIESQGPDISQIASSWLGSLTGLIALRMFRAAEIESLGGMDAFLSSAWESSTLLGVEDIYAIPWLTDVNVIAFRRDLLAKAKVDETTAFEIP